MRKREHSVGNLNTKPSIEYKSVDELIPYARNSRTHDKEQVSQIMASIKEFGFTNPILIDDTGTIIAGHGRVQAAQKLNLDTVPTICLDYLTDAQKKAYVIADNRLALNAGWDFDMLKVELEDLNDLEFDVSLLGFDDKEINDILADPTEGLVDEDKVPDLIEDPITKEGDLWILGNHRLLCGDSTSIDAVNKLMDGNKSDMVFTDPPYGMSYGGGRAAGSSPKGAKVKAHGMIINDDLQGDNLMTMVSDSISNSVISAKEGAAVYVCFTWRTYTEFYNALESIEVTPKACIVWDKKSIGLGNSNYRPQHEFIFYCGGQWYGDKGQSDVWKMGRDASTSYVHPTQKPVELIEKAILNSSKGGDIIHDCFAGSGSTLIACEKHNRDCMIMELDPKYCDTIIKRWQDFTGKEAVHLELDKTYNELINNINDG